MEKIYAIKYLSVLTLPLTVALSFSLHGAWTFLPLAYIFGFIPILEMAIGGQKSNVTKAHERLLANNALYDWLLYLIVPIQYGFLLLFFISMQEKGLSTLETVGRITGMGILCGNFGINVAHELGHRTKTYEQLMAKTLLLTSLYMHFFIEHNRGHHRRVSTEADPATSRFGETVYGFWVRSVAFSYLSAWQLERERLKKKGLKVVSFHNEMIRFQIVQIIFLLAIGIIGSIMTLVYFVFAAIMGFLLLETVNYIEHYGLQRRKLTDGRYERVLPAHSWNSDHIIGRLMMFELSRHSDHHYKTSRKYQILRHHENSPQMPTGYPGMMVIALIPPLWFAIMHRRIRIYQKQNIIQAA